MSHAPSHPQGRSYASSGPAGGRTASGLSRRRTQFQGAPPSFYRNGGWGAHGAKREAAQDGDKENAAKHAAGSGGAEEEGFMGRAGGMGTGQAPFGQAPDVPHFDREQHFRVHENYGKWRQGRMPKGDEMPTVSGGGMLTRFLFISGIISLGVFLPSYIFERAVRSERRADRRTS